MLWKVRNGVREDFRIEGAAQAQGSRIGDMPGPSSKSVWQRDHCPEVSAEAELSKDRIRGGLV